MYDGQGRPLAESLAADLDRLVDRLRAHFGPRLVSVVFYGSRARGEARPESDLDLLVVAEGLPASRLDRHGVVRGLAEEVGEDFADTLSCVSFTPAEAARVHPFYLGMLSGHRLLHDRDDFFAGVLARLRCRLQELGARRLVDEDGYEYWDLKPDWKPGDVVEL